MHQLPTLTEQQLKNTCNDNKPEIKDIISLDVNEHIYSNSQPFTVDQDIKERLFEVWGIVAEIGEEITVNDIYNLF